MSYLPPTYPYQIYQEFKALEERDYRAIVAFYEEHVETLQQLEFRELFEVLTIYANALFEIGEYEKHIEQAGSVIRLSIMHNVKYHRGKDIYQHSLFRKAASHYNVMQYDSANHILTELIKMHPRQEKHQQFLRKSMVKNLPGYVKNARAGSVLLFLAAAIVILGELLTIRPAQSQWLGTVVMARNSLFIGGILLLTCSELFHRRHIYRAVKDIVQQAKQKKRI